MSDAPDNVFIEFGGQVDRVWDSGEEGGVEYLRASLVEEVVGVCEMSERCEWCGWAVSESEGRGGVKGYMLRLEEKDARIAKLEAFLKEHSCHILAKEGAAMQWKELGIDDNGA